MSMLHEEITGKIIKAFYEVYNVMGYGFLERVYENSMMIELEEMGMTVEKQKAIKVYFKKRIVGDYFADILAEEKVIIELKTVSKILPKHESQLLNYLKATDIEIGLILNFGPEEPKVIRKIFENHLK